MDIACPNCGATYRVPDALIDGVNALRCVACGHAWVPDPPRMDPPVRSAPWAEAEAAAPAPVPEPPPPPADPLPARPEAEPVVEKPPAQEAVQEPVLEEPVAEAEVVAAPAPAMAVLPPMRADTTLSLTATHVGPPELRQRRRPEGGHRRRWSALALAWAVSIALVTAFVLGLLVYRAQISAAWPPFGRLVG